MNQNLNSVIFGMQQMPSNNKIGAFNAGLAVEPRRPKEFNSNPLNWEVFHFEVGLSVEKEDLFGSINANKELTHKLEKKIEDVVEKIDKWIAEQPKRNYPFLFQYTEYDARVEVKIGKQVQYYAFAQQILLDGCAPFALKFGVREFIESPLSKIWSFAIDLAFCDVSDLIPEMANGTA